MTTRGTPSRIDVLPSLSAWILGGLLLGCVLGLGIAARDGRDGREALAGGLMCSVVGGILGLFAGMGRAHGGAAVAMAATAAPPPATAPQLWDQWLDDGREAETTGDRSAEAAPEPETVDAVDADRPLVRPRVVPAKGAGEAVLLHDEIGRLLEREQRGAVAIFGGPGSGKTTALSHLANVLPPWAAFELRDDLRRSAILPLSHASSRLVIFTLATRPEAQLPRIAATYVLAPWDRDDLIEYLLKRHPAACASVMARLTGSRDEDLLGGTPELCAAALDRMAEDPSISGAREAILRLLDGLLPAPSLRREVEDLCLRMYRDVRTIEPVLAEDPDLREKLWADEHSALLRLLRHPPAQLLLAARRIADVLVQGAPRNLLPIHLPADLLEEAGRTLGGLPRARAVLKGILDADDSDRSCDAMAASLLHLSGEPWRPARGMRPILARAHLPGIRWLGVDLQGTSLEGANLAGADLWRANLAEARATSARLDGADLHESKLEGIEATGAKLRQASLAGADATGAVLTGADLTRASLEGARLNNASLSGASLRGACLRGACLCGATLERASLKGAVLCNADLRSAILEQAVIDGADFTEASLEMARLRGLPLRRARLAGASFAGADLEGCDLEGIELHAPRFSDANLHGAQLTGSIMPRARFRDADLRGAGLGGA
jgi:uncharacterized protein YjbI with pentapeptide repeats